MHCFIPFNKTWQNKELPKYFTNPFEYTPHPLCIQAAKQLQTALGAPNQDAKGKMYGVLIVKNKVDELGFLAAFSGNEHSQITEIPFVPQVFDITNPKGFFRKGEEELNQLNQSIKDAENSFEIKLLRTKLHNVKNKADATLKAEKLKMAKRKKIRQVKRESVLKLENKESILKQLIKESQTEKSNFSKLKKELKVKIATIEEQLNVFIEKINNFKQIRKTKSAQLQKQIFDSYLFLNAKGIRKNASAIFKETDVKVPPAGAGDCCAPKLLQHTFLNNLKPIAMAEFWWGKSPKKEIRKHAYYYPACKSKCEPILGHMLKGLSIEKSEQINKKLSVDLLYEDYSIAIINKPSGLLSVPGKKELESVYSQVKILFPNAEGPLIVHRLDMATSGIMLIAKTKNVHENLQKQFLNKTIQKRYVAILNGIIDKDSGTIELPLRVDLDDRPRQLVCFEYGKPALTKWKVVGRTKFHTRIHFYPISGRTHQLRVHAAHEMGLNTPILGDELYGIKADRLLLHAEEIQFIHPSTAKNITFKKTADF